MKASEMHLHQQATIQHIYLSEKQQQRLTSLGMIENENIYFIMCDPWEKIMIFQVKDTWIALEKSIAEGLEVIVNE